jgi:hypothetical protein
MSSAISGQSHYAFQFEAIGEFCALPCQLADIQFPPLSALSESKILDKHMCKAMLSLILLCFPFPFHFMGLLKAGPCGTERFRHGYKRFVFCACLSCLLWRFPMLSAICQPAMWHCRGSSG